MLNRTIAPDFQPIRELHIMPLQTENLQNNTPLHWLGAGDSPVLKLEVLFHVTAWKIGTYDKSCFLLTIAIIATTKKTKPSTIGRKT